MAKLAQEFSFTTYKFLTLVSQHAYLYMGEFNQKKGESKGGKNGGV